MVFKEDLNIYYLRFDFKLHNRKEFIALCQLLKMLWPSVVSQCSSNLIALDDL